MKSYASEDTKTVLIHGGQNFTLGEHQSDTLIVSGMKKSRKNNLGDFSLLYCKNIRIKDGKKANNAMTSQSPIVLIVIVLIMKKKNKNRV